MAEMTKTNIAETASQKSVESTEPKYASVATRQREVNERTPDRRSGIIDKMPSTRMVSLLTDPGVQPNRHQISRGKLAKTLQRRVGNRNTALLLQSAKPSEQSEVPESVSTHIEKSRGQGQPLGQSTRAEMESGFGEDFGGVRVHSGTDTERTAERLGAKAYTAVRDIYFGRGGYQPETAQGKHLLAHELAHTVQQRSAPALPKAKMGVSTPDDPAEQEAESAATAVMKGEPVKHPLKEDQDVTGLLRTEATPVQAVGETVGASAGPAENGDLVIKLGNDVRIEKSKLEGRRQQIVVDLADAPATVPGVRLNKFLYWPGTKKGELMADVTVPFVSNPRGGLRIQTDKDGVATLSTKTRVPIAALNNPEITLSVGNDHQFTGNVSLSAEKLKPRGLNDLRVDGGGEVEISAGKLKGSVHANLEYAGLAKGKFDASFVDGVPKGSGQVDITQDMLKGAGAAMSIEEGSLKAEVTVPAAKIVPSLPGIEIPSGDLNLTMTNGDLSGGVNNLLIRYKQFGEAGLTGTIRKGVVDGTGTFTLKVPAIDPLTGTFGYRKNKLFGSLTVSAQNIPGGLVQSGSITGRVNDKGQMGFGGSMAVALGSVARGDLKASYDEGGSFGMGADVQLSIPGLQDVNAQVNYVNGALEGDVEIPIAGEKLAGLSGNLHVWYKDKRWKGEQKIAYERDNGKLKGDVLLGVAEKVNGGLAVYGGGDVTAQLTSFLQGTLGVKIKEDGTTTLKGAIRVTEPLELFPQKKMDRELFSMSRNIPLWAILVAVIRMRAGVRAGIGPGQLRDITVQGEYTVGGNAPTFDISGELYIPAYVEAYVAFGAGLGLDVLIGSLTGGIEAVGTAGIYGAVSVLPVLSYANGNYTINGTATMAAAAKLKLGLQAWAEVEALWITVWENTWQLAEWVWDVGPTLAIQANMSYTFGQPEPPTLDFKTDNIDAERLIQDAMPKDGPKGSGARDALKNRANWSGRNKGKGKSGDKGGSEVAPKGKATPKAPPKPSRKQKPTGKDADAKRPIKEKGGQRKPGLDKMIDKAAKDKLKSSKDKSKELTPKDKLDAAKKDVEALMRSSKDTKTLADRFGPIKSKYGLKKLEIDHMGTSNASVEMEINPRARILTMGNLSIMVGSEATVVGSDDPIRTEVKWTGQPLKIGGESDIVGKKMTASPLAKDHAVGAEASTSTTHSGIMNRLPGAGYYIRGHLLNANVGGPATQHNLFPITSQANSHHRAWVESYIKREIAAGYVLEYTVEVQNVNKGKTGNPNPKTTNPAHPNYYWVNSRFKCTSTRLNTKRKPVGTKQQTIIESYDPESAKKAPTEVEQRFTEPGTGDFLRVTGGDRKSTMSDPRRLRAADRTPVESIDDVKAGKSDRTRWNYLRQQAYSEDDSD